MRPFPSLLLFLALATLPAHAPAASGDPLADGVQAVTNYDYGTDRTAIVEMDTYIRSHPGDRAKVEAALLPLLSRDGVSNGAKDYICRWLGVIGSDASVPFLQKLTADPKLSHLAVYALFDLHTPASRAALLDSLGTAAAALRPAILGAIGRAGIVEAVPVLARAASSGDTAEATAALDALGAMGTPVTLEALRSAQVAAPLEAARQWALVHAAGHVLKEGASGQEVARSVLTSLLKPGTAATLRLAAADACVRADPTAAFNVLLPLLKDDDVRVRCDAVRLAALFSPDHLRALAQGLPSLDPATQAALVNNLVEGSPTGVEPVLQASLASTQPGVRLAAIAGYGTANLPDSASVLLPLLGKGGDEAAAAADSLKNYRRPEPAHGSRSRWRAPRTRSRQCF